MGRGWGLGKHHVSSHFPRTIKVLSWQVCLFKKMNYIYIHIYMYAYKCVFIYVYTQTRMHTQRFPLFSPCQSCLCFGVSHSNQDSVVLVWSPKIPIWVQLILRKAHKHIQGEKIIISTNGARTSLRPYVKTHTSTLTHSHTHTLQSTICIISKN